MPVATLTSKSQITVPSRVRHVLGLKPGARLTFTQTSATTFSVSADGPSLMSLAGILKAPHPATLADFDDGIAQGAAETLNGARP